MNTVDKTPPETLATKFLRRHSVPFSAHLYSYEEQGGTGVSARELNVPEHSVIKTLIMENEKTEPFIILMHGDCRVSTKELARQGGFQHVEPCRPEIAQRHTGYMVGGTSPFGTREPLPLFMEKSILDLPLVYINGGKRGFLVGIHPHDILRTMQPTLVSVKLAK